jgi:hypothetical protein
MMAVGVDGVLSRAALAGCREVGGLHLGRPFVCCPRQTSVVGLAGDAGVHPAMTKSMRKEASEILLLSLIKNCSPSNLKVTIGLNACFLLTIVVPLVAFSQGIK